VRLTGGSTAIAPHALGEIRLHGQAEILACRPPSSAR
jgi:hypothetical protein